MNAIEKMRTAEAEKIQRGDRLVAAPELRRRWGYAGPDRARAWKQLLWKLKTGRHPSGEILKPVLRNNQGPVFRVEDVVRVEEGMQAWNGKDRIERARARSARA